MSATWVPMLRSLYTSPENGQKMAKSSVFWRFFGTFWAITWPINAQWASNWQESQLVCSQSHSDALNTLVGCQELTGVCLRRVPGAKITLFWVFWGHNSINKCLIRLKLSGT